MLYQPLGMSRVFDNPLIIPEPPNIFVVCCGGGFCAAPCEKTLEENISSVEGEDFYIFESNYYENSRKNTGIYNTNSLPVLRKVRNQRTTLIS